MLQKARQHGFTLVEILLVIAILAVLASVVLVAINPSRQLSNARDAQRETDAYTIMTALHQYALEHEGLFPEAVTTDEQEICITGSDSCADLIELLALTDGEAYLVEVPIDPLCVRDDSLCTPNGTGYLLYRTDTGRIAIEAQMAENSVILITR